MGFNLDSSTLIMIVMIGLFVFFFGPVIIEWIRGKVNLTERPRDAHEMLRKKMLKAAKLNIKGSAIRRVVCIGDTDVLSVKIGKAVGLTPDDLMTQVFIRTKVLRPSRWLLIPPELCGHLFGKTLVLYCNGIHPLGNFYVPVFSRKLNPDVVAEFSKRIDLYENYMIIKEENVELTEQRVAAWDKAVNAGDTPTGIVTRQDSNQLAPGGEEKKYAEEQT